MKAVVSSHHKTGHLTEESNQYDTKSQKESNIEIWWWSYGRSCIHEKRNQLRHQLTLTPRVRNYHFKTLGGHVMEEVASSHHKKRHVTKESNSLTPNVRNYHFNTSREHEIEEVSSSPHKKYIWKVKTALTPNVRYNYTETPGDKVMEEVASSNHHKENRHLTRKSQYLRIDQLWS